MLLPTPPSRLLCKGFLAFIGDTKDNLAFIGDMSLVANLDGENELRRVFPDAACAFPGGGETAPAPGLESGSNLPWHFSLDRRVLGGDLTRNLCGVRRASTGDRVS